jgi:hypothetical protein
LAELSADGRSWQEADRQENNNEFNGSLFTGIFSVACGGDCRSIRLVNIGKNYTGCDTLVVAGREIFESLIEKTT